MNNFLFRSIFSSSLRFRVTFKLYFHFHRSRCLFSSYFFFAYDRKASLDSIFQIPFPSEPFNLNLISSFLNTCLETCFSINQVEAEIWCVLFSEEKGCTNSTEKREGRFLCCDTEIKFMLLVAEALQKRET